MGAPRPSFTLGIEEEFQIVDPETRALKAHIQELFAEGESRLKDKIKREFHQSVIEVGTGICRNIAEARADVTHLRRELVRLTGESGLAIGAAGTHPFTHWSEVPVTPSPRYERILYDLGTVARGNLIFGLHVHVAVEHDETRIALQNAARYFLPHVFALSTNSPFWGGRDTGWKSYRAKVFDRFPRTGIPDQFASWADYTGYVETLVKTNCIDNPKKIWWDVRPHPFFPTLEYRICDIPMRVDETICLAALFQAHHGQALEAPRPEPLVPPLLAGRSSARTSTGRPASGSTGRSSTSGRRRRCRSRTSSASSSSSWTTSSTSSARGRKSNTSTRS